MNKDEIIQKLTEDAKKVSDNIEAYQKKRAELNDVRFNALSEKVEALRLLVEKLQNNHLQHMGEEIFKMGMEIKELRDYLHGSK